MSDKTEFAWLIERHDLKGASIHYMEGDEHNHGWTPDANKARKFATAADAKAACLGGDVDGPLRVVDHGFMSPGKTMNQVAKARAEFERIGAMGETK